MLPLFGGLLQFVILCAWFVYAVKHTGLAPPPPLTRPIFREMLARPVFREMLALVIVTCFFFLLPKSWPLKTGVVRRLLNWRPLFWEPPGVLLLVAFPWNTVVLIFGVFGFVVGPLTAVAGILLLALSLEGNVATIVGVPETMLGLLLPCGLVLVLLGMFILRFTVFEKCPSCGQATYPITVVQATNWKNLATIRLKTSA